MLGGQTYLQYLWWLQNYATQMTLWVGCGDLYSSLNDRHFVPLHQPWHCCRGWHDFYPSRWSPSTVSWKVVAPEGTRAQTCIKTHQVNITSHGLTQSLITKSTCLCLSALSITFCLTSSVSLTWSTVNEILATTSQLAFWFVHWSEKSLSYFGACNLEIWWRVTLLYWWGVTSDWLIAAAMSLRQSRNVLYWNT